MIVKVLEPEGKWYQRKFGQNPRIKKALEMATKWVNIAVFLI